MWRGTRGPVALDTKVVDVVADSKVSWEDAARTAVVEARTSQVHNVRSVEVRGLQALVDGGGGSIAAWRVNARISFAAEGVEAERESFEGTAAWRRRNMSIGRQFLHNATQRIFGGVRRALGALGHARSRSAKGVRAKTAPATEMPASGSAADASRGEAETTWRTWSPGRD